jgi:hypothetical protein
MDFSNADAAAIAVLRSINPRSIIENFEYCGLIYRIGNRYNYTIPRRGAQERDRSNASLDGIRLPFGAVEMGNYHTHGDYTVIGPWDPSVGYHRDRRARSPQELFPEATPFGTRMLPGDHFSSADIITANARAQGIPGYRAYLGTPSGVLYVYHLPNGTNQIVLYRGPRPVITANR